jgi:histidinol-phosphate aminotransferase
VTDTTAPQVLPPEAPAEPRRSPFRPALDGVSAYQAGMSLAEAARRYGRDDFVKLASNENLFGPSPKAYEAIAATDPLELYPDPYCESLRNAIGSRVGVDPSRVIMGAGSETLIDLLMRALLEPGDAVQVSQPTFPLYAICAGAIGAELVNVPRLGDFSLDVDANVAALRESPPKLLILCTPNNPTGNAVAEPDLKRILDATPAETFLLFDEAYFEFNDGVDALALLQAWSGDWLLSRTFSKAYGLAAARVGYAIASSAEIVDYLDRVRPAFNVTGPSQAAALAAWGDQDHLVRTLSVTVSERERLEQALSELQIRHTTSKANFVFVESRRPVADAAEHLLSRGLIVRPVPVGPNGWLRITVGRPADNDRLLAELPGAIAP